MAWRYFHVKAEESVDRNMPLCDAVYGTVITPWSWVFLEKPLVPQLLNNFPIFHGTLSFNTVFKRALRWPLSWARSIQAIPLYPISPRSILRLPSYLRLGLPSGLFPTGFPTTIMHSSSPHTYSIPSPSHPPLLDNSNYTWRRVQVMKLLIMQFPPTFRHFIPLRSKYSPQHPQSVFLP
jgi:hypothetical protein